MVLADWFRNGAPLGVTNPVAPTGVFPPVSGRLAEPTELKDIVSDPSGWSDYSSAEAEPSIVRDLLGPMVSK